MKVREAVELKPTIFPLLIIFLISLLPVFTYHKVDFPKQRVLDNNHNIVTATKIMRDIRKDLYVLNRYSINIDKRSTHHIVEKFFYKFNKDLSELSFHIINIKNKQNIRINCNYLEGFYRELSIFLFDIEELEQFIIKKDYVLSSYKTNLRNINKVLKELINSTSYKLRGNYCSDLDIIKNSISEVSIFSQTYTIVSVIIITILVSSYWYFIVKFN